MKKHTYTSKLQKNKKMDDKNKTNTKDKKKQPNRPKQTETQQYPHHMTKWPYLVLNETPSPRLVQ